MTGTARFGRDCRLRRPGEFKRTLRQPGDVVQDRYFKVAVRENHCSGARLGMTVPKRILKRAVDRNRVKRIIRESFRLHQSRLPAVDVVVGVRQAVRGSLDSRQLRSSLEVIWRRLEAYPCGSP